MTIFILALILIAEIVIYCDTRKFRRRILRTLTTIKNRLRREDTP